MYTNINFSYPYLELLFDGIVVHCELVFYFVYLERLFDLPPFLLELLLLPLPALKDLLGAPSLARRALVLRHRALMTGDYCTNELLRT